MHAVWQHLFFSDSGNAPALIDKRFISKAIWCEMPGLINQQPSLNIKKTLPHHYVQLNIEKQTNTPLPPAHINKADVLSTAGP